MNADRAGRRHRRSSAFVLAAVLAVCCCAFGAGLDTVREGADEVLHLDGLAEAKRWGPAECTVAASKGLKAAGRATVHLHIPVDHKGGEKAYPIGWPRMYLDLRPGEKGWKDFERFEFMVHATMTRPKPPKRVINLQVQCPDRQRNNNRNLSEIRLGKWTLVSIPISEIRHVENVARLGLNISESDYRHGEKLDFHFGAFRLARAAEFALAGLAVRSRVMYADRPTLKLDLHVVGPPGEVGKGLPLTVRRGKAAIHTEKVAVKRGVQTVRIDLAKAKPVPGTYTVAAFDGDAKRRKAATFRVVESPWQEAGK